jgi:hypothetical protein
MARRGGSPALRRLTAALADMCVRFQKRLASLATPLPPEAAAAGPTAETGIDTTVGLGGAGRQSAAASERTAGAERQPGAGDTPSTAEDGDDKGADERQRRRRARAKLDDSAGSDGSDPTKFDGRNCRQRRGGP